MIDIRIELLTDINDSAPYLTKRYANNKNVIKLLYSNWCHYSSLIPSSNNLILRKNKLIKEKNLKLLEILPKDSGIPLSKSEVHELTLKKSAWRICSKLVCTFKFKLFLGEKISVFNKTENKYPQRLKIGLDLSNSKQLLTYKNRQQTFIKTIKEKGIEYFKVAIVLFIPEDYDSLEKHLLQLHTCSVTKEKYEIFKKQLKEEKDPNIVFQTFCILEDNNKKYI